ncbi:putative cAMP-dependent protein kinase, regulatory subunit [uncultured Desulfatiglans sp.]|nr:putative cAMP-dependent protein kinase, regulatory subunit [uncultured Desulfatiglans sp.]
MPSVDFLGKVDLLRGLDEPRLLLIQESCQPRSYALGERLFKEDEIADRIWIVERGEVGLFFNLPGRKRSDENLVVSISSGESLGWSGFMPPYRYSLSAYCNSERCDVLMLMKDDLTRLSEQDHRLGYMVMSNLAAVVSRRFDQLQEWGTVLPLPSV